MKRKGVELPHMTINACSARDLKRFVHAVEMLDTELIDVERQLASLQEELRLALAELDLAEVDLVRRQDGAN